MSDLKVKTFKDGELFYAVAVREDESFAAAEALGVSSLEARAVLRAVKRLLVLPQVDTTFKLDPAPTLWETQTLRERLEWAIRNKTSIRITYIDKIGNHTSRLAKPLSFEGEGFMEKLMLIDLTNDEPRQFFVSGIDAVEQA